MKTTTRVKRVNYARLALVASVWVALAAREKPAFAAEKIPAAAPLRAVPKSIFIIPTNPQEGRDPFFPLSTHTPGSAPAQQTASGGKVEVSLLFLNGLNLKPGSRMAIINGKSIAEGETADVSTANGVVSVHCVEIKKGNSVVIEVGGQTLELRMRNE